MDSYESLVRQSQERYVGLRRKLHFFDMFAGGVIEALREQGYRLAGFEKLGGNIELALEQRDLDECRVLILPYRTDLPYVSQKGFMAQVKLELARFCYDPDLLRQAMDVQMRASFGSFLGGSRMPQLDLRARQALMEPGTMTFELRGSRLCTSVNVILDLNQYRLSEFELDIPRLGADLRALFYGVEKYLDLLLSRFGATVA